MNKCICPIFSQIFECDTPQETIYKSQKDFLTSNLRVIRVFLSNWEVAGNTNFSKKGSFPENKCICPIFSQIVECDKPQETIYKSQKDILTSNVQVIRVFFRTWEIAENTNFWKKNAVFQRTNVFAPYFLKLSSVTNFRKGFIRAEKIFWQATCK